MSSVVNDIAKLSASTKGVLVLALAAVGGIGVGLGHWSGAAGATDVRPVTLTSSSSSAAAAYGSGSSSSEAGVAGRPAPMEFDTHDDPNWKVGVPLREMDRDIFEVMRSDSLQRTALLDVFPDRPYKVRLVGSVVERRFGLVMVDLDRDGKWDERWELKAGEVRRFVEKDPNVDGQRVEYTLVHGKWQPH